MRILIGFILGIVVGAYSLRVYEQRNAVPPVSSHPAIGDTTREAATGMQQAVSEKLADWHLTPDEVRADLSHSGQVVREKAQVAGARIVDARIVTVIKAKYVLDHSLSARDLSVEAQDGVVTLRGTVPSAELVGHAAMLALDTEGVRRVVSQINAQP
jgi:osmotically-inducible protein OsmY